MKEFFRIRQFIEDIEATNEYLVEGIEICSIDGYLLISLKPKSGHCYADKLKTDVSVIEEYFADKEEL